MDMSDLSVLCKGVIERIGMTINGGEKNVSVKVNGQKFEYDKELPTHTDAFNEVKYILCESEHKVIDSMKEIDAVGHRIVQGGSIFHESVLVDEKAYMAFSEKLDDHPEIETVFIVTDSDSGYRDMISGLNVKESYQLYRDYLDNFRINAVRR